MFLVQYALYRGNAHYNELVVRMKQTSASCFTLNTLLLFDNHTKYFLCKKVPGPNGSCIPSPNIGATPVSFWTKGCHSV